MNRRQHDRIIEKFRDAAGGSCTVCTVGVWGLTFKANTDDLRDSPALVVCERLLADGAVVRAYDPVAGEGCGRASTRSTSWPTRTTAAAGAQLFALLTEWDEFRWLDFARVAAGL